MKKPSFFFAINAVDTTTAEVYLYGYIGWGEDMQTGQFIQQLKATCEQYAKIKLRINSGGGSVTDGIAIINAIKQYIDKIEGYIDGVAASMAAVISLVLKKCYINKYARLMTHRVQGGCWGNGDELRTVADLCDSMDTDLAELIAQKTGLSVAAAQKQYITTGDKWMTAEESINAGLMDGTYDGEVLIVPDDDNEDAMTNFYRTTFQNRTKNVEPEILILL